MILSGTLNKLNMIPLPTQQATMWEGPPPLFHMGQAPIAPIARKHGHRNLCEGRLHARDSNQEFVREGEGDNLQVRWNTRLRLLIQGEAQEGIDFGYLASLLLTNFSRTEFSQK